MNHWPEYVDI